MAPHRIDEDISPWETSDEAMSAVSDGVSRLLDGNISLISPCAEDAIHDLVAVGFGPASLAIACALHDSLEADMRSGRARNSKPKVLFLEKQDGFAWHSGMLLPSAKMQISFIKDMATLRDPRSRFTFINYLHENGRLVEFTNLGTFLPQRAEYEDYLRWCAGHFKDVVRYSTDVTSVSVENPGRSGPVKTFIVSAWESATGRTVSFRARNVLVAIGGQPKLPDILPKGHPRVLHSSQFAHHVPRLLPDTTAPYRVAVLGSGQSAAEAFNSIHYTYPASRTWLVMKSEFLKPSDDSPL